MQTDYHIRDGKGEIDVAKVTNRLAQMAGLLASNEPEAHNVREAGRNLWTRTLDAVLRFVRRYAAPLHMLGLMLMAAALYLYARFVALTCRLNSSGETRWPSLPAPSVVTLWHSDAPSLLVAFARQRLHAPAVILIASDPRGDCLALLCRMLGFEVVRTSGRHGDWSALTELADKLRRGACAIITADGGGPAKVVKFGAVALASATGVPLVPLAADCHPALQQTHKWDDARNPLPFCSLSVSMGTPRTFEVFVDRDSIEQARNWLEEVLSRR